MYKSAKLYFYRLLRKNDGSAIIEYAIVAPIFFMIFFGLTEYGLFMYHKIAIERIAVDVSRITSIGKSADAFGPCSSTVDQIRYIECTIQEKARGLINGDRISVQVNTLAAGGATVPDICLVNPANPDSRPPPCPVFEEVNGTPGYQGAVANNAGTFGSVMEVLIYYPWSVQIPLFNEFFGSVSNKGIVMISASTIIKNEPLGNL